MKKNRFFVKYILLLIIVLLISVFFITKYSNSNESNIDNIKLKAKSEILYLDSEILYLLNGLNNIIDANYYVSIQEVNENQDSSEDSETSGSKQEGESSKNSESQQSSQSESAASQTEATKTSQMNQDTISQRGTEIDWKNLEGTIQTVYSSWSEIILDLYKLEVNSEDILGFSNQLDESMQFIQAKDKQSNLTSLAKLYSYLPKFLESYSEDTKLNTILKVKSNVINAYSMIEEDNWQMIVQEIANAESNFNTILNNVPDNENSIYNINKAYVVLKELQSSLDSQNVEIFYLKYRNLISELNVLI